MSRPISKNGRSQDRRQFVATGITLAGGAFFGPTWWSQLQGQTLSVTSNYLQDDDCCQRTYATVADAIASPRETVAYVPAIRVGTASAGKPDYLATIDLNPESKNFGQIVHRLEMLHVGDELHHFGWASCSSCHGTAEARRYMVLPGLASSRIYIIDTADPLAPTIYKVVEPEEIKEKSGLSGPHTVHCLANGQIMVSMLGDANGDAPGGFLLLNDDFSVAGRWERNADGMNFNYDFWYQPRHNVMISSEWGAPNTVSRGFRIEDVQAGEYGRHLHFWDWTERTILQSIDLGEEGMIPLEVRFHHNPDSTHGFVGAALSSTLWHWHKPEGDSTWVAEKVIEVQPIPVEGWPFPVPGLITDIILSMDDRFLYFSNWLHGDLRQYDVSDPANPKLVGQLWLGGLIGKEFHFRGKKMEGGPQMLQLSLDGKRLYVTNSLYSHWDDQFYPEMKQAGSWMLQIDCDTESGGMKLNESFLIDFGAEPEGAVRAHEIRFPTGDSTSDIWS